MFLREASKFLAGLIAADFIFGLWVLINGSYPFTFSGITFSTSAVYSWMAVDLFLFLFLVHYAWHAHLPGRHPRKSFLRLAGWVFAVVSVAHFLRLFFALPFIVGTLHVPYWTNLLATIVTAFLSWTSFSFAKHSTN